ncbi:response regulator transcription factor [Staphylococcus chromogenes]|nr:response regulator transcription factor [Staphylococcus chromogenes]
MDDESLIASSLGTLLSLEDDLGVVAMCTTAAELRAVASQLDVCVLDLNMPGPDGIELAIELGVPSLIVTSDTRPAGLKRALKAGIKGFMLKTASASEFACAIREIHAGKTVVDPELAVQTINLRDSPLTSRETEVLALVGEHSTVEKIAAAAFLAPGTTRNYLSSAMSKIGAENRYEAYFRARGEGWV